LLPAFGDVNVAHFGYVFLLGAACALYAERIEIDDRLGLLAGVIFLVTLRQGGLLLLGVPAFAYLCLYLAVRLPLAGFDRHGDFSYGTYIYAFPLQQMLALHGLQRHGLAAFMAVSLVTATAAAFVSWHLIERPALRLKDWAPWRRSRSGRPAETPDSVNSRPEQDLVAP
jgi:peptidoglycan/LPS O-acetylase OafA/YrhL